MFPPFHEKINKNTGQNPLQFEEGIESSKCKRVMHRKGCATIEGAEIPLACATETRMRQILDLDRFPLDRLDGVRGRTLLARCHRELHESGMFSLAGLIRPEALERCVADVEPLFGTSAFTHSREHNIYFDDEIEGLEAGHPALGRLRTVNHTVCGDLIPTSLVTRVYEWQPLIDFLAAAMDKPRLLPDGGSACAHQRHGLPVGRCARLALRSGGIHHDLSPAGASGGR